ncbi:hypothetical protein BJY04DRAFT_220587 [Aspergillus karnatakaensis]|uniref:uncharacterized protein n=1 Tax=Aspergillus karnatakaensis TaxID=1810916 RepID=UPI003CCD0032
MEKAQLDQNSHMDDAAEDINRATRSTSTTSIVEYLRRESPEFRRLRGLQQKGWNNPAGDTYFRNQRRNADNANQRTAQRFYDMMKQSATEIHQLTGIFCFTSPNPDTHRILDTCMAPGGFLATALALNPTAQALAFTLPQTQGGHAVLSPLHPGITTKFLDITLLAADMGITQPSISIPPSHPDAANFIHTPQLSNGPFDLALCDGQVLRTQPRAPYREAPTKEATRLITSQLSLAVTHLKPGGSLLLLLSKVEAVDSIRLIHTFDTFADVRLVKPSRAHKTRSSFYLLARGVRSGSAEARGAVERWKQVWGVATFGTDEEYQKLVGEEAVFVEKLLQDFGPKLIELARGVWNVQADALERAPFVR